MKPDEIKLRLTSYANDLIDNIFPGEELFARLKSATAKFWVEQNIWKLDAILNQFKDANGNIDMVAAEKIYSETIFDDEGKLSINLRNLISNESINKFIPNSTVLFTTNDLHSLLNTNEKTVITDCSAQ